MLSLTARRLFIAEQLNLHLCVHILKQNQSSRYYTYKLNSRRKSFMTLKPSLIMALEALCVIATKRGSHLISYSLDLDTPSHHSLYLATAFLIDKKTSMYEYI